jgi:hypothetical protein
VGHHRSRPLRDHPPTSRRLLIYRQKRKGEEKILQTCGVAAAEGKRLTDVSRGPRLWHGPHSQLKCRMRVFFTTGDFLCRVANFPPFRDRGRCARTSRCPYMSRSRANDAAFGAGLFCSSSPSIWVGRFTSRTPLSWYGFPVRNATFVSIQGCDSARRMATPVTRPTMSASRG